MIPDLSLLQDAASDTDADTIVLDYDFIPVSRDNCLLSVPDDGYVSYIAAVDIPCARLLRASRDPSSPPVLWQSLDRLPRGPQPASFLQVGYHSLPRWSRLERVARSLGLQRPVLVSDDVAAQPSNVSWAASVVRAASLGVNAALIREVKLQQSPVILLDLYVGAARRRDSRWQGMGKHVWSATILFFSPSPVPRCGQSVARVTPSNSSSSSLPPPPPPPPPPQPPGRPCRPMPFSPMPKREGCFETPTFLFSTRAPA